MRAIAVAPVLWAIAWVVVEVGGAWLQATVAVLVFALAGAAAALAALTLERLIPLELRLTPA